MNSLLNSAKKGVLPQTLLFLGKGERLSKELAEILLKTPENNPDFFFYDKEDYKAEDVRKFLEESQRSGRRVFVFKDFDEMDERVQNFLLKTFEEPKKEKYFFLIVKNINKILPTILSRAVVIEVKEDRRERIRELVKRGFSDDEAMKLSLIPYDIEIDEDFTEDTRNLIETFDKFLSGDEEALIEIGDFFENKKGEERIFIDIMIIHLRNSGEFSKFPLVFKMEEIKSHIEMNVSARNAILAKLYGEDYE